LYFEESCGVEGSSVRKNFEECPRLEWKSNLGMSIRVRECCVFFVREGYVGASGALGIPNEDGSLSSQTL
jgi:hypothetical protein